MTALASYSTGTVSVAAGGTTVTGVGTIWSGTNARPGDVLQIGNFQSVISDVTDLTQLVVPPWGGGAQVGVAYKIWQVSPQRFAGAQAMQTVNELVAALNTTGFFVFVDVGLTAPDPSLGDDGQYAFQPTTGKTWAKVAGVWTYLGIYKGFSFRGPYDNAATYSYGDVQTTAGSSYVYINATPSAGHAAPNATYWQLLASIGATGNTGATGAGYGGTSATSLAIGTGSKVFTTQAGLAYQGGARVRTSSNANGANYMEGLVTAYSGTSLTINADTVGGSGTFADWNINLAGNAGTAAGALLAANNLSDLTSAPAAIRNLGGLDLSAVVAVTAAATLTSSAFGKLHLISGTSSSYTVTLPTPVGNTGAIIALSVDNPTNATKLYTIASPSGNVGRATSLVMWAYEQLVIRSDGANWVIVSAKQIPFVGRFTRASDLTLVSATITEIPFTVASDDPTGLNLCFSGNRFVAPRASSFVFSLYSYHTSSGASFNQNWLALGTVTTKASGTYSWTGSVNAGTVYGTSRLAVTAGANILAAANVDGTGPKVAGAAVSALLDFSEVCPSW
ncbi:UNVERIFIED_ORG: hypothetical protein M2193_000007 [Bradyrhizobium japonicum]|uniref:hypothetical protein n=1 Tax=Bradyrhizobium diazoefficiens TaxID=1355477 RepID=UPI00349626C6